MKIFKTLRLGSIATLLVLLFATVAQAQTITLTGTVMDESGIPVTGATVIVLGETGKGATVDLDGNFTIAEVPSDATIRISFVGMVTQEIALNGRTRLDIVLKEDSELLDEVVVVGYGTQKKVNLTGSVSAIDGDQLKARPVQNVGQALQGVIPGLNFNTTNGGGALNSRLSFNIRGTGTIGEGSYSSPLVLIDGVEGDLNRLNPADIDNISVLKDAASSAIYGSRAAFGVILITTKSGKEGKSHITYSGNFRYSTATQIPEMLDSYDFARYWNAAAANSGSQIPFSKIALERILAYKNGTSKPGEEAGTFWVGYQANEPWSMYGNGWANTDWFAEMYRKNAPAQEHQVAVSGGTEKLNYYFSAALLDQEGLIRHGQDNFDRYNVSGRFSSDITDWLNLSYSTKWVREEYSRPAYMTGLFFHNIARRWPTNTVYDPNGHYAPYTEIIEMEDGGLDNTQTDALTQQLALQVTPLEGWIIRGEGSYKTQSSRNHWDVQPIFYYDKDNNPTPMKWGDKPAGKTQVGESMWRSSYFNVRLFTEYSRIFAEKHDVKLLAGMDMEKNMYESLGATRDDLITGDVPTINQATNEKTIPSYAKNHWATMGFFARANYAYDNRYLLELTVRRDGSSRFIGDKRWAVFPSVSAGWNIANESFFEPLHGTIDMLKLRGSWGELGNTNTNSLYPWFLSQPFDSLNSGWIIDGKRQNISNVPGLVTPDLTWETVQNWTVGLDVAVLRNRLQGSFDYFVRNTYDMVGPAPEVPSILGTALPKINNTDMQSYGWELELRWRDQIGDFSYGARLVLSDDTQKVTRYFNESKNLNNWYDGREFGDIWGYRAIGIAQTDEEMQKHLENNRPSWGNEWGAGDVMYENLVDPVDENGEYISKGEINNGANTLDDHGDLVIIGNSQPHYRYSLSLDAAWKGLDIAVFLQGVGKRDFWDASPYFVGANVGMWQAAGFKEHLDYWRPADDKTFGPNPNAYYPRPLFGKGGKNFHVSDRYLQDASYLRIKNVQIGYTLPEQWTQPIGLSSARIYVSGDNLHTFTKLSKIFDPEATGGDWGPGKIYPLSRTISFGMNLSF